MMVAHVLIVVSAERSEPEGTIEIASAGLDRLQTVLLLERALAEMKRHYAERN